jgi:hypothetical protein
MILPQFDVFNKFLCQLFLYRFDISLKMRADIFTSRGKFAPKFYLGARSRTNLEILKIFGFIQVIFFT